MLNRRGIVALVLGVVVIAGAGMVVFISRQAQDKATAAARTNGLKIPTVDEMCKTLGATQGDALKQCQGEEQAAGEFVVAWMGLNNFIVDGEINLGQIQLLASLDDSGALSGLGSDPSLGFDPSADPSLAGDPSAGAQLTSGIDPITGAPLGYLQAPAELALYCLQMSGDWIALHDCISENDPSSHIGGVQ
jgi:hypothetical protein